MRQTRGLHVHGGAYQDHLTGGATVIQTKSLQVAFVKVSEGGRIAGMADQTSVWPVMPRCTMLHCTRMCIRSSSTLDTDHEPNDHGVSSNTTESQTVIWTGSVSSPMLEKNDSQVVASSQHHPQMTMTRSHSSRADYLDGLRGLAAVLVFFHHLTPDYTLGIHETGFGQDGVHWHFTSLPFIRLLWNGGNATVPIFFVLSGYALSIAPLRNLKQGNGEQVRSGLIGAMVRRPIRLYTPAVAITLLQAVLLHIPRLYIIDPAIPPFPKANLMGELDTVLEMMPYFSPFRDSESDPSFPYNKVMWTLPIELRGSLLIYGSLYLLSMSGFITQSTKAAAMLSLTLFLGGATVLQSTCNWSLVCFAWGTMLAILDTWPIEDSIRGQVQRLYKRRKPIKEAAILPFWSEKPLRKSFNVLRKRSTVVAHVCFVVGWYLLSAPGYPDHRWYSSNTPGWRWLTQMIPQAYDDTRFHRYWTTIGSLPVVYAVLRISWLQRFFSSRALNFLGRISFALYLVHSPWDSLFGDRVLSFVGGYVNPALKGTFWDVGWEISNAGPPGLSPRFLVAMAVVFPSTVLVAWLATVAFDEPSVRLGKWVTRKMGFDQSDKQACRQKL